MAIFGLGFGTRHALVTTDIMGGFALDLVQGEYEVDIDPPQELGLGNVRMDNVPITPETPRIDYRYTGIRVQGTILAPTGASVDSGYVSFYSDLYDYSVYQRFQNGTFSVLVPRSGTYRIAAYPLKRSLPPSFQTLAVTADTTLVIQIEGVPVTGTVFGPDGMGLEGATVRAESLGSFSYGVSEAGGRYQFWVREGGYRFRISPPDDMRFILTRITSFLNISGPTTLDVSLAGTRWSGFVRSVTDSSVVSRAAVSAALVADYYVRSAVDTTGADGRFELVLESGKEYDLSVDAPSMGPFIVRGLFAGADSTFDLYVGSPTP